MFDKDAMSVFLWFSLLFVVVFCFVLFCFVLFIIVAIYCLDVSREIVFSTSYRALEFSVTVIFFLQKYFAEKLKKVQLSQRNLFLPLATRMNVQHYVISENLAAAAGEKLSGNQPLGFFSNARSSSICLNNFPDDKPTNRNPNRTLWMTVQYYWVPPKGVLSCGIPLLRKYNSKFSMTNKN